MRKLFKSKLFWVSIFIVLILAGYSTYADVNYVVDKFYSTGSESFSTLPDNSDELPTVSGVLYSISSAHKNSRGTGVSAFLWFYITVVSIVAIFLVTKLWEKKGKKIILRISSFILGPIIGILVALIFVLLPQLGAFQIVQFSALGKADAAIDELIVKMKSVEGRKTLGIISDEEEIIKKIKENPTVPAIINDDDSFTENLIIAAATIGRDKTAFEAVAIPQAVFQRNSGKNSLFKEIGADQLLLSGHILAIRNLIPEFGRKILPIIGEKIIHNNKLIRAKISESGKGAPKYIFLTVEDYRKLREAQTKKDEQNFTNTINLYKGYLARGVSNSAEVRQWLVELEKTYQNYLVHPVVGVNEAGTATTDSVQVFLVDENDIPSDLSGLNRYFISSLAVTVHELMHYYSNSKAAIPNALEEAMTAYYELSLLSKTKILKDSELSLDNFIGYKDEEKIIEELAKEMSAGDLAALYFSGNQARFAKIFEQKYAISYNNFINRLDMIFYASSPEESKKSTEELLSKLKGDK